MSDERTDLAPLDERLRNVAAYAERQERRAEAAEQIVRRVRDAVAWLAVLRPADQAEADLQALWASNLRHALDGEAEHAAQKTRPHPADADAGYDDWHGRG